MVDETVPEAESDLRRRAAWLLGMLGIVAVLFVVVLTVLIGNHGSNNNADQPGPLDGAATTGAHTSAQHPSSPARSTRSSIASTTSASSAGPASCPSAQPCALDGDIGNAVAAVNAYRTQHGKPAVPGSVTAAAKQCALQNGNGCSGGWAETQLSSPDGAQAVQKILQFGQLLSSMKSFGVGWAYDPGAKQYFFSIIRST